MDKIINFPVEKKEPNRNGFGRGLVKAGGLNDRVWVVTADLRESTRVDAFAKEFPNRFVDVGVAEQNLVTVASGIAHEDKIVFATSYATFSPGRNWEQIRTTICYNNQPVRVIGEYVGLGIGEDGATHQALEDVAMMRALPNMTVVAPVDSLEAQKLVIASLKHPNPMYIRLNRNKTPLFTKPETPFEIGQAYVYRDGTDVTIISTGTFVYRALGIAQILSEVGVDAEVISSPTIKPLDESTIVFSAEKTKRVVTLEDHQIAGGFGGAVSELLSLKQPVPVLRLGIDDEFGQSGDAEGLYKAYGLAPKFLATRVQKFLEQTGYTKRE